MSGVRLGGLVVRVPRSAEGSPASRDLPGAPEVSGGSEGGLKLFTVSTEDPNYWGYVKDLAQQELGARVDQFAL